MKYVLFLPLLLFACAHAPSCTPPALSTTHAASPCMAYAGRPLPKTFQDFDADNDGQISKQEFLCQVVKYFDVADKDHDSFISKRELKFLHKAENPADQHHDGKIDIVEFMETAENAFKAFDADKSGTLSESEFNAGLKAIQ